MILAIKGSDSYLAHQAIAQIKDRYRAKHADSVELVEFDGGEPPESWTDLAAMPLFVTTRLVIIRYASQLDVEKRLSLAYQLERLPSTTIAVVWLEKALGEGDPLAVVLDRADKTFPADPLEPGQAKAWLTRYAERQGCAYSREVIDALVTEYGSDLWALTTALVTAGQTASTGQPGRPHSDDQKFVYFSLTRRNDWNGVARQLQQDYQRGLPIELVLGSLGAAVRKLDENSPNRRALTNLMADLDFGLKSGVLEAASVYALLIAHLPKPNGTRLQWQKVWEETVS